MSAPHELSVADCMARLQQRELTAAALVRSCLSHVAEREPQVQAWEIVAPDATYAYRVHVRGDVVRTEPGDADDARVVLGLALPDYLRLINGLLDGTQAFMDGRLRIRGDVMFATQVQRMFRTA